MCLPFEIRVPTVTADIFAAALKAEARRWCGNDHEILGYSDIEAARAGLLVAKIATLPGDGDCEAVRGFTV